MYESPIETIQTEIQTQFEDDCIKAIQSYGFMVNKEEIVKALNYDRKQYDNGYADGYNNAIDDFVRFANTMPIVEEEDGTIRPMWLEEIAEQLKAGGENGIDNQ